jgi:apolipoprotein N-acyltransferase
MSPADRIASIPVALRCIVAGLLICAALPPWGWWPLAFVGIALLDLLVADQRAATRFRRTWLVCVSWLAPGMLWMWDLTPPGYVIASIVYAAYFGVAVAATPPGRGRRIGLPAAFVLAEATRWAWPFGGVPLATIPEGQAAGPLAEVVRIAGSLLLVAVTVVVGQALASLLRRQWRPAVAGSAVALSAVLLALVAPTATEVGQIDVAIVQGGGPQRTRAAPDDATVVFARHVEASELIEDPVDLIVWPENVVHVDDAFEDSAEARILGEIAQRHDATVLVGVVETIDEDSFTNDAVVIDPSGEIVDRYAKVRLVPFGEFVPLRSLIERFSGDVPGKDAVAGDDPAIVDTPVGPISVPISWEVFFAGRVREGVQRGAELVVNPTNGSSYWLTMVQTQQIASSRLRSLENDRWVLQAAPTGFSAVVEPDGSVAQRTSISEREVLHATVGLRDGDTWAVVVGDRIPYVAAVLVLAGSWILERRRDRSAEVDGAGQVDRLE